jgi:hypothetical protein
MPRTVYVYTLELTVKRFLEQQMPADDDAAALVKGVYHHDQTHDSDAVTDAKIIGKYPVVLP